MSIILEANKALVHKWIEAWRDNNLALLDELFTQDYSVNGTVIGIEGVKQAVQFLHAAFSDISAELNEMVAEDDQVVVRWTVRGRQVGDFMGIAPTGKFVELQGINIYRVRAGKISANHERTNVVEVIHGLKAEQG
jgi:steroid delta-isomerase-like uncharacterized protein